MLATMSPDTAYARTEDGVHIAYKIEGDGPVDLVVLATLLHVEHVWRWRVTGRFFRRLAASTRLIMLDRRGTALSDHMIDRDEQLSLESRMDDIRAVMDASGSERAVILGLEDGFHLAAMFAATYPERTTALIAYGASARYLWAPDYPFGTPVEQAEEEIREIHEHWGSRSLAEEWVRAVFPEETIGPEDIDWFAELMRLSGGPGDVSSWLRVDTELDVRDVLPTIRTPTLVIHREHDSETPIEHARYIADAIPGAVLDVLPGRTHGYAGDLLASSIEGFIATIRREEAEFDRTLATVLFTDVVSSTERAATMGDTAWREIVLSHHKIVRGLLARFRGREMDTAGDGFFATFDGPARAVRCAQAAVSSVRELGIEIRAGVHTGEVEKVDEKVGGIAVAIGARIAQVAQPSEVLASSTVKELTAGSGIRFAAAGEHELKGVPEPWTLYRVIG
jgi:class 3 adenylate cyclase